MISAWSHYFIFLAETLTILIACLIFIAAFIALVSKNKSLPGTLSIQKLNEKLADTKAELQAQIWDKKARKAYQKALKKKEKEEKNESKKKVFVLSFRGDMHASQVQQLREEITALLQIATPEDEVILKLESPGGLVSGYGLAASQLLRLKEQKIPLTVCVDKIAASGGYLMACVADHIIAAPFAIIGSIGVVAQLPNFHRLLKKLDIDVEQITAGKYKRTLTVFGENTKEGREKMQADLEEIHAAFKHSISTYRPSVNVEETANGDYWLASDALKLKLVDRLMTSDDYLFFSTKHAQVFEIKYTARKTFLQKFQAGVSEAIQWIMGKC